jgi:3-oxoacyl-[acyl-carrier-protein] synthase III
VDYHCAWDQGKHLWMVYLMWVIGAQTVLDKPGSVVLWTNCRHPFYDHNPHPQAAPPQRPVWVGDFGTCSAPGTPWSCRIPPPQRPARHPRLDEMSLPMNTPTVSLIDVSTYLPENRVPAEWYAGHAGADNLRDNPMFAPPAYRHHAAFDESNVDMIERASAGLVARHGPEVLEDVDVLLTHSEMPDLPIVGAGGELAHRLGMTPQWILDVHNSGCAAFVSMLKLAQKLLASGAGRTALIAAAANAAGKVSNRSRSASSPNPWCPATVPRSDCSRCRLRPRCSTSNAASTAKTPADMTLAADPPRQWWQAGPGEGYVGFNEAKIMKVLARGNRQVPEVVRAVCDRIAVKPADLDLLVTNQPNRLLLRNWHEALEIPPERHRDTFGECGNLFAVGIPVNLEAAINDAGCGAALRVRPARPRARGDHSGRRRAPRFGVRAVRPRGHRAAGRTDQPGARKPTRCPSGERLHRASGTVGRRRGAPAADPRRLR